MKLLKIDNNQGYYLTAEGECAEVDKITKEDLLRLVALTLQEEDVEYDEYSDETLKNQAHQIIYKSVFDRLKGLRERREEFIDESERLYLAEYERYDATREEDDQ